MTMRGLTGMVGSRCYLDHFIRGEIIVAEEKTVSVSRTKVSPARTAASMVLLLIVGIICVIELRAGLGQMLSGRALAARSNDGEFTDLSFEEAIGLLKLAPEPTVEKRSLDSIYRFEWYSVLRPLLGQQNPQITIIASNDEKPMALAFTTADEEPASTEDSGSENPASSPSPMPGGGMMGPGGGPESGAGERTDGRQRPEMEESNESAAAPESDPTSTPAASTETPEPTPTPPAADASTPSNP